MKFLPAVALSLLLLGGAVAAADAIVVTDEERIQDFVEVFDQQVDTAAIDEGMVYIDTEREEVEVVLGRYEGETFEAGEDADLGALVREELAPLVGRPVEVVSHTVELQDRVARVALRLRIDGALLNATFDLRKHGDRFFIRRARVSQ